MTFFQIKNKKGLFWRLFALFYPRILTCATTLFDTIYMPDKYFDGSMAEIPKQGLLLHEREHIKQWEEDGWSYIFGWLFSKEQRRKYEMEAYEAQIRYLHSQGECVNIDIWAKSVNSLYSIFEFISVEEAKTEIVKWIEI